MSAGYLLTIFSAIKISQISGVEKMTGRVISCGKRKEADIVASMSQTIERLCMALNKAGREISVEKKVFYSIVYEKLVTVWKVKEGRELLLKTYKAAEAVKFLAALWKELKEDGADNAKD